MATKDFVLHPRDLQDHVRLKAVRLHYGISQQKLAEYSRYSIGTIANSESGRHPISFRFAYRCFQAFWALEKMKREEMIRTEKDEKKGKHNATEDQ